VQTLNNYALGSRLTWLNTISPISSFILLMVGVQARYYSSKEKIEKFTKTNGMILFCSWNLICPFVSLVGLACYYMFTEEKTHILVLVWWYKVTSKYTQPDWAMSLPTVASYGDYF
jgi:hypothetical protein